MAEATGLEPTSSDLEADVLPIELHLQSSKLFVALHTFYFNYDKK